MSDTPWTLEELLAAPARSVHPRTARFQDVDAAGIVFFPRIVEYLHDAYVDFLAAAGCPLQEVLASKTWAAPIKDVQARFLKPLRFGDRLQVCVVKARLEGSDLRVGYRVQSDPGEVALAVGQTAHVFVNATTFKREPPPEAVRQIFTRFEGA